MKDWKFQNKNERLCYLIVQGLRHAKSEQQQIWTTTYVVEVRLENEASLSINTRRGEQWADFPVQQQQVKIASEEIGVVWEKSPRIINQNLDHPRK